MTMDERKVENAAAAVKETAEQTQEAAESAASAAEDTSEAARQTTQAASRTSVAAETSAQAAQTTATAAVITKDSAERRTELAGDRTIFAAERTYAAWVRTGLVGLAGGIGARSLLDGLVPGWMVMGQATVLMLFAIFCFAAGVWRQLFKVEPEAPDIDKLPGPVLIAVNIFLALVAATALLGIWVGGEG
jgi:putative membrane protein